MAMAATVLNQKHKVFARVFARCLDIEAAAKEAGLRRKEAVQTLANNTELQALVREYTEMDRIAADFMDEESLRLRLFRLAMDEGNANVAARLRAASLFFETGGKTDGAASAADKFAQISEILQNAKK